MAKPFFNFEQRVVMIEQWVIFATLVALVVILFIQVLFRFLLGLPLDWTEEAARLLFAWLVYIGAAHALYRAQHFVVDFIYNKIPAALRNLIGYAIDIITIGFIVYLAWFSFELAIHSKQTFPVLGVPRALQFIALPIGLSLMVIHAVSYMMQGRHIGDESADPLSE